MSGEGYNFAALICGAAGSGKTSLARVLVARHLRERPAGIVLAHDPAGQFARRPFADAAAARAAIVDAQSTGQPMPRVLSIGGDSVGVTDLALELGARANNAKLARRPILVVYDEGSLLSGSGATWIGRRDQESLAIRRHRGVGSIYLLQRPRQLPEPFWDLSTECYLFRSSEETAARIEQLYGLPRGHLRAVTTLPRFHFLHVQQGGFGA